MADTQFNIVGNVASTARGYEFSKPVKEAAGSGTSKPVARAPRPVVADEGDTGASAREQLRKVVDALPVKDGEVDESVRMRFDEETKRVVVQVVNSDTDEVIRQLPNEDVLRITRKLREYMGLAFDIDA